MDYTIICLLAIVLALIMTYFAIRYLKRKKLIDDEILQLLANGLGLSIKIADELDIKNKKELKLILVIVNDAVSYANKVILFDNNDIKINTTYNYALQLAGDLKLELTQSRKDLIMDLIKQTFNLVK